MYMHIYTIMKADKHFISIRVGTIDTVICFSVRVANVRPQRGFCLVQEITVC